VILKGREMTVNNELIDRLLADYKKPEDLIGENGLLKQLTKRLVERALEAEMSEHLGHDKNKPVANASGNTRNGKSKMTRKGEFGELPIDNPSRQRWQLRASDCCQAPNPLDGIR
jgi:putative transposase